MKTPERFESVPNHFHAMRSSNGFQLINRWYWYVLIVLFAIWSNGIFAFEFEGDERIGAASLLEDWEATMQRSDAELKQIEACLDDEESCQGNLKSLRKLILRGRTLEPAKQLRLINWYVNRSKKYSTDRRSYREFEDFRVLRKQEWSTLLEFRKRGGDCDDFATAKYVLLKLFGYEPDQLRIVIVYDRSAREHHALVAIHLEDIGTRLLDIDGSIHRKRPSSYRYVYSLNEDSIWDHSLERERKPRRLKLKNND